MAEKNYRAELVGVFGDPVDGNPTGVVEEAGFAAAGLNYRYITCRVAVEDLADAMRGMRATGMKGVNLTMPHKIAVLEHLDELSEAARIIGAVNTVVRKGDKFIGENTDGKGFVRSVKDAGIPLEGKVITILGAGGAAKAIGVECALAGAKKINIINRNHTRGEELVKTITENTASAAAYFPWEGTAQLPEDTEILINGTCVGLHPDVDAYPDINYDCIKPGMPVCDVVFNPAMPVFLKKAEEKGANILTGLGMLVNQAALNFELWTGVPAPRDVMMEALIKEFE
ncbi:MAG: shikimate dehydrogenase [Clostridia bacterium]|nr:shikimate dehydrogenase [Clostridia bacterium]